MRVVELKSGKYAIRRCNWFKLRLEYLDLNKDYWWSIKDRYTQLYYSTPYKEIAEKRLSNFKLI